MMDRYKMQPRLKVEVKMKGETMKDMEMIISNYELKIYLSGLCSRVVFGLTCLFACKVRYFQ